MENITVWNVKPEWWGSPLVQEKYQGEEACDKRQHNKNKALFVENGWFPFEHHYKPLGTIKSRKFIDQVSNYVLLKKQCSWS